MSPGRNLYRFSKFSSGQLPSKRSFVTHVRIEFPNSSRAIGPIGVPLLSNITSLLPG